MANVITRLLASLRRHARPEVPLFPTPKPSHELPPTLDWDSLSEPERRAWADPQMLEEAELMKQGVRNATAKPAPAKKDWGEKWLEQARENLIKRPHVH